MIGINRVFRFLTLRIYSVRSRFLKPISIQGEVLLTRKSLQSLLHYSFHIIQLLISLFSILYLLDFLFSVFPWVESTTARDLIKSVLIFILITTIAKGLFSVCIGFFSIIQTNLPRWLSKIPKSFRYRQWEFFQMDRLEWVLGFFIRALRIVTFVLLALTYTSVVLGLFSWTKGWSEVLFSAIFGPVRSVLKSILDYIPNLLFIIVMVAFAYYASAFCKFFFEQVERGKITLNGFNRDWSSTTYKIIRFLLIVFTTVVAFPYLPGANSEAFKGVSLFLGILFSLGSTSIVANIVAGVVLTYMLPFRIGDRVQIGDTVGDVIEKNLLVTRIKTVKNVIVTIPNSSILNNQIVNYSSSITNDPIILHTKITLGYELPWKKVHETLVRAALKSENVLKDPKPFVLQTNLGDFSIEYELNAYSDKPHLQARTYSALHQNIQDECAKVGIEILSPTYHAIRSGRESTIPPNKGRNL